MSWCSRGCGASTLLLLAVLAGCGFRPLYGEIHDDAVSADLAAVQVAVPESVLGSILLNELAKDLNPAGVDASTRYRLNVRLERTSQALLIQLDDVITRFDLTLFATYELTDLATNERVLRSAARRVASYNVVSDPFATQSAADDAERRAARELAKEIQTQLAIHFAGGKA